MPRNYESYKQNGGGAGAYSGVWTPPRTFNTNPSATGWRYKQKMRHQATEDWANRSFNNQNQHNQHNKQQQQKEYYRSFNPPKPPGATWTTGSPRTGQNGPSPTNGFHQPKSQNATDNWFRDRFDNFD